MKAYRKMRRLIVPVAAVLLTGCAGNYELQITNYERAAALFVISN